ncbi:MAG: hypothetical protein QM756_09120 [Polyangiaceae bacterium]
MSLVVPFLLALATLACSVSAVARCSPVPGVVASLEIDGLSATSETTIVELLPRRLPARYSAEELLEFERRVGNLGIFDAVSVACAGSALRVSVREKWTLVPRIEFATGTTLSDMYALLGATEYNFLGRAIQLGVEAFRRQRGFGGTITLHEHDYQRRGWSLSGELSVATAAFRFDDGGWQTASATLELSLRSPPLGEYFNYAAGFYGSSETVYAARGVLPPPSTQVAQSFMAWSWDAYHWHDLVPRGAQASIWLSAGGLFGQKLPEARHTAELITRGALALGPHTALIGRLLASCGTRGNVNYSFALGSVDGVRGLRDATYYNWAQGVTNLELRQSFRIFPRWALQAVAFADVALFEQVTFNGDRGSRAMAASFGLGARVVPTWIANVAPRIDVSRLVAPDQLWFVQVGLNQYF